MRSFERKSCVCLQLFFCEVQDQFLCLADIREQVVGPAPLGHLLHFVHIGLLIILDDRAYHYSVICKLHNGVGFMYGYTVVCVCTENTVEG